mmetsp:Transcript_44772/g.72038  ORF Transcript_44772/g.72038 Transcript_44772/m.72038 type:complete len:80 (+) Transcript_44772:386-625(+)
MFLEMICVCLRVRVCMCVSVYRRVMHICGTKKIHISVDEHDGSSIQRQSSHLLLPEEKKSYRQKKADFSSFWEFRVEGE